MDMSIPVMRLILVLIILGIWCLHGTQRNLVIHIPVYMINTSIPVTDFCILFAHSPVMFTTQTGDFEIVNLTFLYVYTHVSYQVYLTLSVSGKHLLKHPIRTRNHVQ